MLCRKGLEVFLEYKGAARRRGEARDRILLGKEPKSVCEKLLFEEECGYSQAFVAWVTHRGFCIDCRASSVREDRSQFASV